MLILNYEQCKIIPTLFIFFVTFYHNVRIICMRKLESITGKELLKTYFNMFENHITTISDKDIIHFSKMYDQWLTDLIDRLNSNGLQLNVSLSKTNYLGKKTRALLSLLEIKTPKNLNELSILLKERL